MTEPVTLPFWLFAVLVALAGWSVLVLLLAPSMRWFLRRRINRMIAQLNATLSIELPSFKLTRREALIERLMGDTRLQAAVLEHVGASGQDLQAVWQRVGRYVAERRAGHAEHMRSGQGFSPHALDSPLLLA